MLYNLKLVEGWQKCHAWWSVRLLALSGVLQFTYEALPQRVHDDLPTWASHGVSVALLALTVVTGFARLVDQKDTKNGPDKPVQS